MTGGVYICLLLLSYQEEVHTKIDQLIINACLQNDFNTLQPKKELDSPTLEPTAKSDRAESSPPKAVVPFLGYLFHSRFRTYGHDYPLPPLDISCTKKYDFVLDPPTKKI